MLKYNLGNQSNQRIPKDIKGLYSCLIFHEDFCHLAVIHEEQGASELRKFEELANCSL